MNRKRAIGTALATLLALATGCGGGTVSIIEDSETRRIVRLDVASANVYVIEENGRRLMIDAGNPGDEDRYEALMREVGIDPATIDYAILTHGHIDHAGMAAAFQDRRGIEIVGGAGDQPMIAAGGKIDLCPTSMSARLVRVMLGESTYPVVCEKSAVRKLSHFRGFGVCRDCRFRPSFLDLPALRFGL